MLLLTSIPNQLPHISLVNSVRYGMAYGCCFASKTDCSFINPMNASNLAHSFARGPSANLATIIFPGRMNHFITTKYYDFILPSENLNSSVHLNWMWYALRLVTPHTTQIPALRIQPEHALRFESLLLYSFHLATAEIKKNTSTSNHDCFCTRAYRIR